MCLMQAIYVTLDMTEVTEVRADGEGGVLDDIELGYHWLRTLFHRRSVARKPSSQSCFERFEAFHLDSFSLSCTGLQHQLGILRKRFDARVGSAGLHGPDAMSTTYTATHNAQYDMPHRSGNFTVWHAHTLQVPAG